MGDISSILRELSNLTLKKIIIVIISCAFLIAIWRFDAVIDAGLKIRSELSKKSVNKTTSNEYKMLFTPDSSTGISSDNLAQIREYLIEYLNKLPKSVYSISVYKFLPPGHEYSYQGRILVAFKSKFLSHDDESRFLRELNANWIPMWSGKRSVEYLINGNYVSLNYDDDKQLFKLIDESDHIPNSNFSILGELGIKSIFRFPIVTNDQTIGYISIYLTNDIDSKLESELKRISTFLSNRLSNYLLNRGGSNVK